MKKVSFYVKGVWKWVWTGSFIEQQWTSHKPKTEVHVSDVANIKVGHGGYCLPIPRMSTQIHGKYQKLEKQDMRYTHKGPNFGSQLNTVYSIANLYTENLKTLAAPLPPPDVLLEDMWIKSTKRKWSRSYSQVSISYKSNQLSLYLIISFPSGIESLLNLFCQAWLCRILRTKSLRRRGGYGLR